MNDDDNIVGHLKMEYKEMRNGEYILDKEDEPIIKKYELHLTRKHLSVLKMLMMDREKIVMMENPINVHEAQEKDKILKQLYELLGYE